MPQPNPRAPADPLARVRAATHASHARLDAALPIAQAGAGMVEYRGHLRLLRDWLLPMHAWEQQFHDGPQDPALLPRSERLRWLLDDLDELGESALPVSRVSRWPVAASPSWRWGVAYVVEGSQLGARVLFERLRAHLGPHHPRLLAGGGETPGVRWRRFLDAFGAAVATDEETVAACDGARHAFDEIARLAGLTAEAIAA